MSKLFARIAGYFSNRSLAGVDKVGNRYFAKTEAIDGISKWVSNLNPLFAFNNYFMIWVFLNSLCICTFVTWVLLQLH
jgi:hypothetical protein